MPTNPPTAENEPAPARRSDRPSEPLQPDVTQKPTDSSPVSQDEHLIGAERLPRKGDDE